LKAFQLQIYTCYKWLVYIILRRHLTALLIIGIPVLIIPQLISAQSAVIVSEVDENIPTYLTGPPDPNPMFFFGRGSAFAEGRIYPYPYYDNLTNIKGEKTYRIVYIENEYIKIGILPELGGRLFSALDKTNNYDFIYRQYVIKPVLIGLTGAWTSGGIEWNIPHIHRASSFIPVQYRKEENPDGSKTVWVGELELRHRMRWAVGYTLRPGSSVIECSVRIINRTPVVNTMLCFANVAVAPNDNYQVIFPPGTQWTTGHAKLSFNRWPVSDSVDQSWYKNHKTQGSIFAFDHEEDFIAGFDHGINAGMMGIADHNIVPGKKFWTWGVGSMWDKILADDGRPYIEIMYGAYSDNQPDYSWLQPFEERSFGMSWYPVRGTDGAKNANLDATVNLEVKDGTAKFGFYTTKAYSGATVRLLAGKQIIVEENIEINPGKPYSKQVSIPVGVDEHEIRASLSADGRELIAYSPINLKPKPKPIPVTKPPFPAEIKNVEELFLAGQRIDQFHDPAYDADPYWEELLKRDPGNVSANTGMGLLELRNARYKSAEEHFNIALNRLTFQYTTPKNAEPLYYLGVALKAQDKNDEAYTAFYRATWSQEWKAPAYYSLSEIAVLRKDFKPALDFINRSLDANANNLRAYGLKAAILRHIGLSKEAMEVITYSSHKTDPLDVRLMAEQWLLSKDAKVSETLFSTMKSFPATAQETAAEYCKSGLWSDGLDILQQLIASSPEKANISPLVYYYMGDFSEKLGNAQEASEYRKQAFLQPVDYVFPFQSELIPILYRAIELNPDDAHALYYLGNLLYDWQPKEAVALWEKAGALDPGFSIIWRNISLYYSHEPGDDAKSKAIFYLEKAVASGSKYPAHFAELDRLYKSAGTAVEKRLALLEKNQSVVVKNDETLGDLINLKIFKSKTDEAIELLKSRTFTIAEGANVFNTGQAWCDAYLVRGLKSFKMKKYNDALVGFRAALTPPENLRAQQGRNSRMIEISYWMGCSYEAMGQKDKAIQCWRDIINSGSAVNYLNNNVSAETSGRGTNYSKGEQSYYIALAHRKLGEGDKGKQFLRNWYLPILPLIQIEHLILVKHKLLLPGNLLQGIKLLLHTFLQAWVMQDWETNQKRLKNLILRLLLLPISLV
jgi:tetratricopeptide (TPR) repeat protein